MKRAILKAQRLLEFEDVALDTGNLPDDHIYAETEFSAVSVGTECAAYSGERPLRPGPIYPRFVGYCNAGRVMKVGQAVRGIEIGDRILTHQSHQSAFVCKSEESLGLIPNNVSSKVASLTYLAHLGLAALQKANFRPGENVGVLGLGVIGLATASVAVALGAQVLAIGNNDFRLTKAKELGAQLCVRSDDPDLSAKVEAATFGTGIDLLITTANSWDAWRTALEIASHRGRVAVLGFPGRSDATPPFNPLEPSYFYSKQLTILAAGYVSELQVAPSEIRFNLQRNMQLLLRLIQQGQLPLEKLITHCVPWYELHSIYELAADRDKSLIGAVLDWNN